LLINDVNWLSLIIILLTRFINVFSINIKKS
jgi:hypothetical protein